MNLLFNPSPTFPFNPKGLFETFPAQKGKLLFFQEHWVRLCQSCSMLGYPFPYKKEEVKEKILTAVGDNLAIVRLTYTLNGSQPQLSFQLLPNRKKKESLKLLPIIASPHPKASHKITAREIYEEYFRNATERGADDALLIKPNGEILETTRANIFLVSQGKIITPPLGEILPGIVRNWIIKTASTLGISVEERKITLEDIQEAEEIFATNSLIGLVPVAKIFGIKKEKAPEKILLELLKMYNENS
jgi:branched-chain amino acid aminotransferase